jgi:hypothetical protein
MSENSIDRSEQYGQLLQQVMVLQRQLLDARVKRALAALAKTKDKPRYVRELERKLSQELLTHHRACKLDVILEMIEETDEVRQHIVW